MSSWFFSPWEAARFSLEAQRLLAVQFFPFAPRQNNNGAKIVTRQEVASDYKSPFVTRQAGLNTGSSAEVAAAIRARKRAAAKTVAARNPTEVIRKATGTRKTKGVKGKRKSNTPAR